MAISVQAEEMAERKAGSVVGWGPIPNHLAIGGCNEETGRKTPAPCGSSASREQALSPASAQKASVS